MTKERGGGLLFLAAGIYGFLFSIHLPLGRWNQPGPAIFPLAVSILLCLSGLSWSFQGNRGRGKEKAFPLEESIRRYVTPLQIAGLTAAFIFTLELLGYLLTSVLYLLVLFLWVSRYRFRSAFALAIVFGVGSWLFFGKLLSTPLPRGFLSF